MAKKPDGTKSGGNGKGGSKGIAGREAQQKISKDLKKSAQKRREHGALMRGDKPAEEVTIFSVADLAADKVGTGCLFEAGGSVFEIAINGGREVIYLKKGTGQLAKYNDSFENIFVPLHCMVTNFKPSNSLPETAQFKQWEIYCAVTTAMGDDLIDKLTDTLLRKQRESEAATLQAMQAERYIGPADVAVWNTALSDLTKIVAAFEMMKAGGGVSIRLGSMATESAVIMVKYHDGHMRIEATHIGQKCPLVKKVLKGTYLRCNGAKLPETEPEIFGDYKESVAALWGFIMNPEQVDRMKVRDPLMHGMYRAHLRLHNQPLKLATANGMQVKPATAPVVVAAAPAPSPALEAKPAPIRPTGKVTKADVIMYAFSVLPAEKAAELSASKISIKLMLDHIDNYVAAQQAQPAATKSA
jgi:hypothetical protein